MAKIAFARGASKDHEVWLRAAVAAQGHEIVETADIDADAVVIVGPAEGGIRDAVSATGAPVLAVYVALSLKDSLQGFREGAFRVIQASFDEERAVAQILEAVGLGK